MGVFLSICTVFVNHTEKAICFGNHRRSMAWSTCSKFADLRHEYKTELTWYCLHDRLEAQYVRGGSINPMSCFKKLKLHTHEAVLVVEGKAAPRSFTARRIAGLVAWGRRWEFSSSAVSAVA